LIFNIFECRKIVYSKLQDEIKLINDANFLNHFLKMPA